MKFFRTPKFKNDFNDLSQNDQSEVISAFPEVSLALQGNSVLFSKYRIKKMVGFNEIWEGHVKQNLCFTFNLEETIDGEKICYFRRIGTHAIYNKP